MNDEFMSPEDTAAQIRECLEDYDLDVLVEVTCSQCGLVLEVTTETLDELETRLMGHVELCPRADG